MPTALPLRLIMKFLTAQLTPLLPQGSSGGRRNVRLLVKFLGLLAGLVVAFSVIFHLLMMWEGREFSWITGFYWTLTVMSTLGFGDITFHTDLGRAFSIIVLLSGMVFLLILLPFTFIEFFYAPWMQAQAEARAPRRLPPTMQGHVLLTHYDPVSAALITRLEQYHYPYAVIVGDLEEALRLYDMGVKVVFGEPDRLETYRLTQAGQAAMIAATGTDMANTNIAFTAREVCGRVPIVTTADSVASVDILTLAGSNHVLELPELMGEANARRVSGADATAHVVGRFDRLLIAEATAAGTPLVGKTIAESRLRELVGVSVVGLWKRGHFEPALGESIIDAHSILLLAGSQEQIDRYNELFCIYHVSNGAVIIIGGGRVGRATARMLAEREVPYKIIEQKRERIRDEHYVLGNAADVATLEAAGIANAPAIIVTAHDDDTNIYLTLYCRRLRPDVQIISRSTLERNISTLHRAGADFVLSYASMGAMAILEALQGAGVLMLAEGLNVCETVIPERLTGKTLAQAALTRLVGCNIVALRMGETLTINPEASTVLLPGGEMIFIANTEGEGRFLAEFGHGAVTRRVATPMGARKRFLHPEPPRPGA